jgi:aspartate aminotransferase
MAGSKSIRPSATVGIIDKARALSSAGINVINMGIGEVMADSPCEAKNALVDALEKGETHYVSSQGIPELREAIAEKLQKENAIRAGSDNIIVTPGAKYALYLGLMALIRAGDEILLPDPGWMTYEAIVQMAGGKPVYFPCFEDNQFRPLIGDIEKRISKRTTMIITTSPSNPTGAVLLREDVEAIANLALKHNLYVVSDEIYEKFVYDGHTHCSMASIPEMSDRTLTINGYSKGWAMTGWRVGYGVGNQSLIETMTTMQQHSVTCTCAFTQRAALTALKKSQEFVRNLVVDCQAKRDLVVETLNGIPGISCQSPWGAFYAFANIMKTGKTDEAVSQQLLEKTGVITLPGSTFGPAGKGYLRFSYALPREQVEEGMRRTRETLMKVQDLGRGS